MSLDYASLNSLREKHPAWRLLASPHAPLIVSFLHNSFLARNLRVVAEADLVEALEDELFALRDLLGEDKFPRAGADYLSEWAAPDKGWLRKFYPPNSDEAQFDLTPATEKAIAWLESLGERSFVGTESRLLILFDLLKQLTQGSTSDPQVRLQELHKQRAAIDAEIAQVEQGYVNLLDSTSLKDRFMQFTQQARELLSDFREVEHNFRQLDRSVRERIAHWEGNKGELLEAIMGERDSIADSDQGASFRAFWDFLMSPARQEEFSQMLDQVLALQAITELKPDKRTRRVHYDWLEAGEHTQRTVALLSQQLRRFLDDQAWLENRRIMEILQGIESKALHLRARLYAADTPADFTSVADVAAGIDLPMERPLYNPPIKVRLPSVRLEAGEEELNSAALFSQVVVDKAALVRHIRQSLQTRAQVSLVELCRTRPLQQGLAELVAYLELAGGDSAAASHFKMVVDEAVEDTIQWQAGDAHAGKMRIARLPRIIFIR